LRLVYVGTSDFAAAVLAHLARSGHSPVLVVTRPDAPRGRGRTVTAPPIVATASELGVEIDQPASINDEAARARIAAAGPDAVVVCAFGALIGEALLADHAPLNVHPSLLPRWRGAAPIERAIMAGDEQTGVCIMRLEAGLDTGPVCLSQAEPIHADDTYGTLAARLEPIAAALLARALDEQSEFVAQDDEHATYAEKITVADRTLDLTRPAAENERIVRALSPHIGARVALADGSYLGVVRARVADDGALELVDVQPAGGRPMAYADYLRGHPANR
jgi:methionyl-tRNA formyltransferase